MNKFFRCLLAAAFICCGLTSLSAQPSREQLAQIRVGKDGNFQYWNSDAASLERLKAFVAAVTTEGSNDYVPLSDRLAVFDMPSEMDAWMKSFLEKPCEGLEGLTWGTALYWPMI